MMKPGRERQTTGNPAGKPCIVPGETQKGRMIRMDEERWRWLRNHPGGAANKIREWIDAERNTESTSKYN